jgi:hypothetical protein
MTEEDFKFNKNNKVDSKEFDPTPQEMINPESFSIFTLFKMYPPDHGALKPGIIFGLGN